MGDDERRVGMKVERLFCISKRDVPGLTENRVYPGSDREHGAILGISFNPSPCNVQCLLETALFVSHPPITNRP
jgi:hypothetical protein